MKSFPLLLAVCWIGSANAQEALYGLQPPLGSAFVRLVNATAGAVSIATTYQRDATLGSDARVTPYAIIEHASAHPISVTIRGAGQERHLSYAIAADTYVSIVVQQDAAGAFAITPILDRVDFNQTRARLAFYNAAPACGTATLSTDPGGAAVFKAIAPGTTIARTVNPVEGSLRAACADRHAEPAIRLGGMQAGSSYSLWLMPDGAGATLLLTTDTIKPQVR